MSSWDARSLIWAAGIALLAYGTLFARGRRVRLRSARLWALSALLACAATLGTALSNTGDLTGFSDVAWALPARLLLYYLLLACLDEWLKGGGARRGGASPRLFFAVILICWTPYFILMYPGVVSNDSISQMKMIVGVEPLTNANPVFQTWLFEAFYRLGKLVGSDNAGVAMYVITQAAFLAWALGYALSWLRSAGAPRSFVAAMFLLIVINPLFPAFAFGVGKDVNFAAAMLMLTVCLSRLLNGERAGAGLISLTALSAVLCALLRNPGVWISLAATGALSAYLLKSRQRSARAAIAAFLCALAAYVALHAALLPALSIQEAPETESASIPLQQVARCVATHESELTEAERLAIDAVMPIDDIKPAYMGELSDPVKLLWRQSATQEQKRGFYRAWLGLAVKYPKTAIAATLNNSYGYILPGFVSGIKPTFLIGKQGDLEAVESGFAPDISPHSDALKAFLNRVEAHPLLRLFVSPGIYAIAVLYSLVALMKKGRKRYIIALLPALLSLLGCMGTAVCGYLRYSLPFIYCAPVLLGLVSLDNKDGAK